MFNAVFHIKTISKLRCRIFDYLSLFRTTAQHNDYGCYWKQSPDQKEDFPKICFFRGIVWCKCKSCGVFIYPTSLLWVGCITRSIFKWSTTGLNLEFSISETGCHNKAKEPSLFCCLLMGKKRWIHALLKRICEIQQTSPGIEVRWSRTFLMNIITKLLTPLLLSPWEII